MCPDRQRRAFAAILGGLALAVAANLLVIAARALPHSASDPVPAASDAAGAGRGRP